jgi:hypothetical protein
MSRSGGGLRIIGWRTPMTKRKLTTLFVVVISAAAAQARAQSVEVSAGLSALNMLNGSDFWNSSIHGNGVDAKVSVGLGSRFAIEPFVTYGHRTIAASEYGPVIAGGDTERAEGVFGVVIHQKVAATMRPDFHVFLTYGLSGMYSREHAPARQLQYGRTVVNTPAFSNDETSGLWYPVAGVGVQKNLGSGLALRAEGQITTFFGIPAGARGSVGIVVPLGGSK